VTTFPGECALLREHLDNITAEIREIRLTGQRGIAVDTAAGRVVAISASHEVFRQQVSLRLANIEAVARWALDVGGEVIIG
jgi:hypothetical protein